MIQPIVAITRMPGAEPIEILERAMTEARFRAHACAIALGKPSAARAVIVPALDARAADSPTAADPRLIEHLIDVLIDIGFADVVVGSTRDSSALWLENRDPFILADLLGYRYETPAGRPYDVVDLAEDLTEPPFPPASPLAGSFLSRKWIEADLRIVFASNRTDEDDGYALCLATLLSVLPLADKNYHYRHRRDRGAVAAALEAVAPVHFAFIDAVRSAHGPGGGSIPRPIATDTILAAPGPALADHYGALLMGLDPFISRTASLALRRPGLLQGVQTSGSLEPYPDWVNVEPMQREAAACRARSVAIDRSVRPLIAEVDRKLFPFVNPAIDRCNELVTPVLAASIEQGDAHLLTLLNLWLGQIGFASQAWATHFDKDALRRIDAPIDIDPAELSDSDFTGLADEVLPFADLLRGTPADDTGLRWRSHDGAILFDGARRYPIDFDSFVSAVSIHRTIQYMNDYIGGEAQAVAHDARGRVTRQVERNLYLPQPNYTVLFGGTVIDVTKVEAADYGPRRQRMVWRTIGSANGSALADDGMVVFEALGKDTLVSIFGRQLFRLPPLLDAIDLDLVPQLKGLLVTDAYRRFFRSTFANLEAVVEGRDVRVGRAWSEDGEELPLHRIVDFVRTRVESGDVDPVAIVNKLMPPPAAEAMQARIDAEGFRHFDARARTDASPSGIVGRVAAGLRHAVRVDLGLVG
jgi:hypothetical protein